MEYELWEGFPIVQIPFSCYCDERMCVVFADFLCCGNWNLSQSSEEPERERRRLLKGAEFETEKLKHWLIGFEALVGFIEQVAQEEKQYHNGQTPAIILTLLCNDDSSIHLNRLFYAAVVYNHCIPINRILTF